MDFKVVAPALIDWIRGEANFVLHQLVYQVSNRRCPALMVEDDHVGLLAGGEAAWDAKASTEHLRDQELRVECPLLVRNDLEDVLHIPSFAEHADRNDPFDRAVLRINRGQPRHVRLMLLVRCDDEHIIA